MQEELKYKCGEVEEEINTEPEEINLDDYSDGDPDEIENEWEDDQ
jgi:hypothetical protein